MRLRPSVVIIINFIVFQVKASSWLQPTDEACGDYGPKYYEVLERCLEHGEVTHGVRWDACYKLYNKGPCNNGEILVFAKGPCLQTECVTNRNSSGNACPDGWFDYNGTCTEAGSQDCEGQFGRRVRPDLYGDVQCVCDQQLGFVEFKGECHFEFLQGPCQEGEQLVIDVSNTIEPKCAKNKCNRNEGYMMQRFNETQYVCSFREVFYKKYNQSLITDEEAEKFKKGLAKFRVSFQGEHDDITPFTTVKVCKNRAIENGECIRYELEPEHNSTRIIFDIRMAFNIRPQ